MSKPSLIDLPNDMLATILANVGEASHPDLVACVISCKTLKEISKFPDVLKKLNLDKIYPAPWEGVPEKLELLQECAKAGNLHAIFLCGLTDYYFFKKTVTGSTQLMLAADAAHPEAMYLYGMLLISENQFTEGSKYLKKLWRETGLLTVRRCNLRCRSVVLELTVRQYKHYDMMLAEIEVGNECIVGEFDEVCDGCFIYKEIFRFIDYMHYV